MMSAKNSDNFALVLGMARGVHSECREVDSQGVVRYYKYRGGPLGRETGPSVIYPDGRKEWYQDGVRHRLDGPAVESAEVLIWILYGEVHREGLPAIEAASGHKEWIVHGKRHRLDGPAVIYANGSLGWWQNGLRHRESGPAVERNDGARMWYQEGNLHRQDGPAVEKPLEEDEFWLEGVMQKH